MNWIELKDRVRLELQELLAYSPFYSDKEVFFKLYEAQEKVSEDLKPLQRQASINIGSTTAYYSLPEDFLLDGLYAFSCNGYPLAPIEIQNIIATTIPTGQPHFYDIWNDQFYLYPNPSSSLNLSVYYHYKAPVYALSVWNTKPTSITAATIAHTSTDMTFTAVSAGGTTTYSINYSASSSGTISELVDRVNSISGFSALINDECRSNEVSTNVYPLFPSAGTVPSNTSCYGIDNIHYVPLKVKIPSIYKKMIVYDSIANLSVKSSKIDFMNIYEAKYEKEKEKMYIRSKLQNKPNLKKNWGTTGILDVPVYYVN